MSRLEPRELQKPLRLEERAGTWWIWFDTPRSAVNIFTQAAAEQILELMEDATRRQPRAVVFASAKSKSFINGAQLMMASAVQSPADVYPLTALLREAYAAVDNLDLPTIAAVRGTCYGCGVEFTLNSDHRVVADSGHTQFYMTELVDYLNSPAFGSTQRLPRLMPLPAAVDFLLWGRRLRAEEAVTSGLASAVMPEQQFEEATQAFVDQVVNGIFERPVVAPLTDVERREFETATWQAIDRLPTAFHSVYQDTFELMLHAAGKEAVEASDIDLELQACGRSLVTPEAQSARSLLFVRQMAERVCLRRPPQPRHLSFVISPTEPGLADFRTQMLAHQHPRSAVLEAASDAGADTVTFEFAAQVRPLETAPAVLPVRCTTGIFGQPPATSELIYHRPAPLLELWSDDLRRPQGGATMLVELAGTSEPDEGARLLFDYLTEFDAAVIFSQPTSGFACDVLAMAYLAPMVSLIASGASVAMIAASLHEFGFLRMPWELLQGQPPGSGLPKHLSRRVADHHSESSLTTALEVLSRGATHVPGDKSDSIVIDALMLSLLHAIDELVSQKVVARPVVADVVVRELLDFPIAHASFCQWATPERIAAALRSQKRLEQVLSPDVNLHAQAFVDHGRRFYV